MDNINFESSTNVSQGRRLQSQSQSQQQPPHPFSLQDMSMVHYDQSSPWTSRETFSSFPPYDNQSFSRQCSSSNQPSLDQSQSMVPMQPFYQRSCANDLAVTNASSASYSVSYEASTQDPQELCRRGYSNCNVTHLNFSSTVLHQPKQNHSRLSLPPSFSTHGRSVGPNKTRIRWNQDLHEKFVDCVNQLGGADKATPKAILKLMDSEGLTIFHVKSHLQKYRIAKYISDSQQGKFEKRAYGKDLSQLDTKTGVQIKEALELQLDVQRHLHEQLEIQRNLQLRIEEQGKQLKKMMEQQQKTKECLLKTTTNTESSSLSVPDSDHHSPPPFSDAEALMLKSYGDTQFQSSKIS